MKSKNTNERLPHSGQILTTKDMILNYIREIEYFVCKGLVYCIATEKEDENHKRMLFAVSSKLWFLSKLVYKNKHNIIVKLSFEKYKKLLFEGCMENANEVLTLLKTLNFNQIDVEYVYNYLQSIELLLCQMISCRKEQVFISELAYAVDYVISHKGNVKPPVFVDNSTFPKNYDDFKYFEYYDEYDEFEI